MNNLFKTTALIIAGLAAAACGASTKTDKAGFLTQALDDSAWASSEWISAADAQVVTDKIEDGSRAADGASWFVCEVKNDSKVSSAVWMTAGLGVYELYVNGNKIGQEILKPGFTHFAKTKRSFTYDVTEAFKLSSGAVNVISAQVTPGWWGDKIITPAGSMGYIGKKCAFRGVLCLTYADGTSELIGTDTENWKAGIAGPVRHAAIFDGEEYDARELPGYACIEKLGAPEVNAEFNGEILPTNGAEIYLRRDIALSPVEAYTWNGIEGASENAHGKVTVNKTFAAGETIVLEPGETLVVDFGQNCAAVPEFTFNAKEGTILTCLPGELLNDGNGSFDRGMDGPEGSVHRLNLRKPETCFKLTYTFAESKKPVTYHPERTFFGYRYVSITATDKVEISAISSIPVSSIAENLEIGTITTGNELINRLIANALWGQRSNYLSVPTDCPQRNERLGWTADTQVFTETGTFFANTDAFFHKWMRDMRDSQSELGGFPGVAPTAQYGENMMRVGWADAGVIVPWTVWKQFGDTSIIEENWEAMEKFMDRVNSTRYDHEANITENGNYQWNDWLSYEPLESCSRVGFKKNVLGKYVPLKETVAYWNYLSASYWAIDAGYMRDMAEAAGKDASKYIAMEAVAKDYLRKTFFRKDGTFKTDVLNTMQTPALFALRNNLFEGEGKEILLASLRKNFEEHGNCLQTGFLGTSILMSTLTENGMVDMAYELLFQRKNPSWLYSIDNGATTIWERWNSYTHENGMGPKGMNSFNHYAYGSVCEWIWETAAGIATDKSAPGFKHIIMSPIPDKRLGFVKAGYNSAAGLITSEWKYEGDTWIWEFSIPEGATATVTLPGETESKEYGAGSYRIEK